jgi:hypothetical protein
MVPSPSTITIYRGRRGFGELAEFLLDAAARRDLGFQRGCALGHPSLQVGVHRPHAGFAFAQPGGRFLLRGHPSGKLGVEIA